MTALYNRNMSPTAPIRVVLDTNVVLDAWWFEDSRALTLRRAIEAGELQWVVCAAMREELTDVLGRPSFSRAPDRVDRVLEALHRLAMTLPGATAAPEARCADPDDQMFLDLTYAAGVRWLVSRDAALLALARTARAWGSDIVAPWDWTGVERA